jgi:hypothetical protein
MRKLGTMRITLAAIGLASLGVAVLMFANDDVVGVVVWGVVGAVLAIPALFFRGRSLNRVLAWFRWLPY